MPYPNNSGRTLMDEHELEAFLREATEKDYHWNNYYQDFKYGDQKVQYKGYWNKERQSIVGLGEIKFEDGSVY